jgi:hypothetical protein
MRLATVTAAGDVLTLGDGLEVVRSDARPIAAKVVEYKTSRDLADDVPIREPVCLDDPAVMRGW